MNRSDNDEDEADTTCPISPIAAPCAAYRESSQKLEIVVRPRDSPVFSPAQLGNISEISDEEIELKCLMSPTPVDPKKPKKSVSFNMRVRVQHIIHIKDFSPKRVADIWLNKSEYSKSRAEMLATIELMHAEKPLGKDLTSVGLEYKLPAAHERRQQDKHTHLHSVLDEQDQQWSSHIDDAQRIADISRMSAAESRAAARTRGLVIQDKVKAVPRPRKLKSNKMSSSVRKPPSSYPSGQECHSEHNLTALQMTVLSAAA